MSFLSQTAITATRFGLGRATSSSFRSLATATTTTTTATTTSKPPLIAADNNVIPIEAQFKNPIVATLWAARQEAKKRLGDDNTTDGRTKTPSESRTEISYPFSTDEILKEAYQNPWGEMRFGRVRTDFQLVSTDLVFDIHVFLLVCILMLALSYSLFIHRFSKTWMHSLETLPFITSLELLSLSRLASTGFDCANGLTLTRTFTWVAKSHGWASLVWKFVCNVPRRTRMKSGWRRTLLLWLWIRKQRNHLVCHRCFRKVKKNELNSSWEHWRHRPRSELVVTAQKSDSHWRKRRSRWIYWQRLFSKRLDHWSVCRALLILKVSWCIIQKCKTPWWRSLKVSNICIRSVRNPDTNDSLKNRQPIC